MEQDLKRGNSWISDDLSEVSDDVIYIDHIYYDQPLNSARDGKSNCMKLVNQIQVVGATIRTWRFKVEYGITFQLGFNLESGIRNLDVKLKPTSLTQLHEQLQDPGVRCSIERLELIFLQYRADNRADASLIKFKKEYLEELRREC